MIDFCRLNDKYDMVSEIRGQIHGFIKITGAKSLKDYIVHTQNLRRTIQNIETRKEAEARTSHRLVVANCLVEIDWNEESRIPIHKLTTKDNKDKHKRETNNEFRRLD
ncbi:hypothetical protein Trydic_g11651 [Trypoxylus dichotomus]